MTKTKKLLKTMFSQGYNNNSAVLDENSSFAIKEAYNSARTNIQFSLVGEDGCKCIIVSSSIPGDGKTTTSLNLAVTFSQLGAKVLIIDCDLRKPRLHKYMEVQNKKGLADALGRFAEVRETINHSEKYGIDFITSGKIPPNPAELLGSKNMKELVEKLKSGYDYIFLDTPPIGVVTDAVALSASASGVILVVRQNHTTHDALKKVISSLDFAGVKILGFILNDVDILHKHSYKYKYKY